MEIDRFRVKTMQFTADYRLDVAGNYVLCTSDLCLLVTVMLQIDVWTAKVYQYQGWDRSYVWHAYVVSYSSYAFWMPIVRVLDASSSNWSLFGLLSWWIL